jgi:AARP2CN (NUC121) domain/ATPase family associated with various cellular activities (AAA)
MVSGRAQAFGVFKASRGKKELQRNLDRSHQREHVALKSRELEVSAPPPALVVVMGPPGVGKTTLIKSLVKEFTRQNLGRVRGPVTVVANKRRRLTFVECPDDVNAMIDLSKVADLALLMVDASFGFEMETFEFLNMLHTHGMPKVMGVLTHLDRFKSAKTQKRVKKELKHRFWVETHDGAKLFLLNGVSKAGTYPKNEIHNLALFLSRMKYRPIAWRIQHPYVLCDRMEVRAGSGGVWGGVGGVCCCSPYLLGFIGSASLARLHWLGFIGSASLARHLLVTRLIFACTDPAVLAFLLAFSALLSSLSLPPVVSRPAPHSSLLTACIMCRI